MGPRLRRLVSLSARMAAGDLPGLAREAAAARKAGVPLAWIRELALQNYLFLGFPRAINVLAVLPPARAPRRPRGTDSPVAAWRRRGERLCRRIYGDAYERMRAQIRRFHPDLAEWIIWEGYGKVLARPGLSARTRELCVLPVLAITGSLPQLRAHVRGARNVGASAADVRAALAIARRWVPAPWRAGVAAAAARELP